MCCILYSPFDCVNRPFVQHSDLSTHQKTKTTSFFSVCQITKAYMSKNLRLFMASVIIKMRLRAHTQQFIINHLSLCDRIGNVHRSSPYCVRRFVRSFSLKTERCYNYSAKKHRKKPRIIRIFNWSLFCRHVRRFFHLFHVSFFSSFSLALILWILLSSLSTPTRATHSQPFYSFQ